MTEEIKRLLQGLGDLKDALPDLTFDMGARRVKEPAAAGARQERGHIWHMDPTTQLATNDTTGEVRYVPNMRPKKDAQGRVIGVEPILLTPQQDAALRRANPDYKGLRFQPRPGHPVFAFDAGHGIEYPNTGTPDNGTSSDNGTPHNRKDDISEANITLRMANYAAEYAADNGYDVIVTRTTKTFSSAPIVATKADAFDFRIAAANNADLYVSFHVNHAANEAANGTQIYIQTGAPADTKRFGSVLAANSRKAIQDENGREWDIAYDKGFRDTSGNINPSRMRNLAMLRGIHVTEAALVETGFLQNGAGQKKGDYDDLRNVKYLQAFAEEIVRDMMNYHELTGGPQVAVRGGSGRSPRGR